MPRLTATGTAFIRYFTLKKGVESLPWRPNANVSFLILHQIKKRKSFNETTLDFSKSLTTIWFFFFSSSSIFDFNSANNEAKYCSRKDFGDFMLFFSSSRLINFFLFCIYRHFANELLWFLWACALRVLVCNRNYHLLFGWIVWKLMGFDGAISFLIV